MGVDMAGIKLHRLTQQLPRFFELIAVAADHAQVVEALHVLRLQLQPGVQQRDRFVVAAGLQMGAEGGAGGDLPGLRLPVHLDGAARKAHIHSATRPSVPNLTLRQIKKLRFIKIRLAA